MKIRYIILPVMLCFLACDDLTDLNENPNGVEPKDVNPNLVLPRVVTEASKLFTNLGFGDIAGVMQHTQKDAWFDDHNDYSWSDQSWEAYYNVLRNNKLLYDRSVELDMEFHQGVSLIVRSMVFGLITDLWGDAPYTKSLNGDEGGLENILPAFDDQQTIYTGILADLEAANELLSKSKDEYVGISDDVEVIYSTNSQLEQLPLLWRKMGNSLMLRYYMRISGKMPDVAKQGIEKIVADPGRYPIITDPADDATMDYAGNNAGDSWPSNSVYDDSGSNYRRIKMCATLVEKLQALNDPRLDVWASRVEVPLVVDDSNGPDYDETIDGVRHISSDIVGATPIDTDPEYVGIPASFSALPSGYNLNTTPGQTSYNLHVSYLNHIYEDAAGPLLLARIISAAEVHFILAEAALNGWAAGDAKAEYEAGIDASLAAWGVSDAAYKSQAAVAYDDGMDFDSKLALIIEQKWIAGWTAAAEAWFDYRRTGLPDLQAGDNAERDVLPVRFYYMQDELNINEANAAQALDKLEVTSKSQADGENSAWSKPWLLQGTGKPW